MKETMMHKEELSVDERLKQLDLTHTGLNEVITAALTAAANATPQHAANATGTLAYQEGTFMLRHIFCGETWIPDRTDGVESISNEQQKIKVAFANVDIACDDFHPPKPRSSKGAGAERACIGNLFDSLPTNYISESSEWATYYLMVDANGSAELTRPIIKNGTFNGYVERIYLGNINEIDAVLLSNNTEDTAVNIEPVIERK